MEGMRIEKGYLSINLEGFVRALPWMERLS